MLLFRTFSSCALRCLTRAQQIDRRAHVPVEPTSGIWPRFDAIKTPILLIRGAESETLLLGTVAKMTSRRSAIKSVEVVAPRPLQISYVGG